MTAPALFIAHGAPTLAVEQDDFTRAVRAFGERLAGVAALLVVSAHWETRGSVRVNGVAMPPPIYDFAGFPEQLYAVRYDAPGSPQLAGEAARLLQDAGIPATLETSRGWDHGLWVPLLHLLPAASKPVVEMSLPHPSTPEQLLKIGAALGPLRDRGIAIVGSGGIVHNLPMVNFRSKEAPAAQWAEAFDSWVWQRVRERDFDTLSRYRDLAPNVQAAVPTPEHFEPLFVAAGASRPDDRITEVYAGWHYATLSMRTIAFDPPGD